eukprot:gene9038-16160_t
MLRAVPLPETTGVEMADINNDLFIQTKKWLKAHGKGVRPKLTETQKQELQQCFKLMDEDGSGAIDAEELGAAFKLLGFKLSKADIQELLDEQIPFALMATAYKRKKLVGGLLSGNKDELAEIVAEGENQQRVRERAAASKARALLEAEAVHEEEGPLRPRGALKHVALGEALLHPHASHHGGAGAGARGGLAHAPRRSASPTRGGLAHAQCRSPGTTSASPTRGGLAHAPRQSPSTTSASSPHAPLHAPGFMSPCLMHYSSLTKSLLSPRFLHSSSSGTLPKNPGYPGHSVNPGHPGHSGNPGYPGHSVNPGHPGHSGNPGHPGHSVNLGNPGHSVNPGHPGHSVNLGNPGHSVNPGHPGRSVNHGHSVSSQLGGSSTSTRGKLQQHHHQGAAPPAPPPPPAPPGRSSLSRVSRCSTAPAVGQGLGFSVMSERGHASSVMGARGQAAHRRQVTSAAAASTANREDAQGGAPHRQTWCLGVGNASDQQILQMPKPLDLPLQTSRCATPNLSKIPCAFPRSRPVTRQTRRRGLRYMASDSKQSEPYVVGETLRGC